MSPTLLVLPILFALGAMLWTLAEYLLHRFAMHELKGKGMMSREHLEHHVTSSWTFTTSHILSWTAMLLISAVVWVPLGWLVAGPVAGITLGLGWAAGYFFYEYQHAMAHVRGPAGRYSTWLRRHHFHHHFGHPMANHGVSIDLWDRVFGTRDIVETVRVPRRLALPWLVTEAGELRPEFEGQYVLVGGAGSERQAMIDRARAFASVAPTE